MVASRLSGSGSAIVITPNPESDNFKNFQRIEPEQNTLILKKEEAVSFFEAAGFKVELIKGLGFATIYGNKAQTLPAVPSSAILHLHDRDSVFVPSGDNSFRRVPVTAGNTLPNKMQEIRSGLNIGQQVVSSALTLQNTVGQ